MKRNSVCFWGSILLLVLSINPSYAQVKGYTSSDVHHYMQQMKGADPRLVSGPLYRGARKGSVTGHPYFIDSEWKSGYVVLDGVRFDSLLLKYDILENVLALNTANISSESLLLCVNMQRTERFGMEGRTFLPFPTESRKDKPRFSESLVEDSLSLLVLKTKTLKIEGRGVDYIYETKENMYLLYQGNLHRFSNSRTLFKLFPELKGELKDYVRKQRLTFMKKNQLHAALLVGYCNDLLKGNS